MNLLKFRNQVVFLVCFNMLACTPAKKKSDKKTILKFRTNEYVLGDIVGKKKSKIEMDVMPEYDSKDTIVYMGSVTSDKVFSKAAYETCTIYFFCGRKSKELGAVSLCFLFQQKITKKDLLELRKELPILKEMKGDHLEFIGKDDTKIYISTDNKDIYKRVDIWMTK